MNRSRRVRVQADGESGRARRIILLLIGPAILAAVVGLSVPRCSQAPTSIRPPATETPAPADQLPRARGTTVAVPAPADETARPADAATSNVADRDEGQRERIIPVDERKFNGARFTVPAAPSYLAPAGFEVRSETILPDSLPPAVLESAAPEQSRLAARESSETALVERRQGKPAEVE